jgi:hypothetical protein
MRVLNKTIITAGDVAGALTSPVLDFLYSYGYAVQASFTGAPTGTVLIQGSNDEVNWTVVDTLTVSGTTLLASHKDAIYWSHLKVTKAAGGTGTMTVTITTKGP